MTTATTDADTRLVRIHETGYWRVVIHPTSFEEGRIHSLRECEQLVEEATATLRVWDYPHIDPRPDGLVRGTDYVQSGSDFGNHVGFWRLFQSAQFVHHFAIRSDRMPPDLFGTDTRGGQIVDAPRWLDFIDVIYTLTEIFEFARSLAYRQVLDPAVKLRIELNGLEGRYVGSPGRILEGIYTARIDSIAWCSTHPAAEIIADAPRLAIDAAMYIFERFNWPDPPRAVFEEAQQRLLEHRLG